MSALVVVASVWADHTQQVRVSRYWDADEYFRVAEQIAAHKPVTAAAPYAYRVLTPWLVARCCARDILHGFLAVNMAAAAAGSLLLAGWLGRFVEDWRVRVLVVAAYVFEWHGPVRFIYYYPVYVDPLFMVLLLAGLLSVERVFADERWWDVVALTSVTLLGALAREAMVLVPLTAVLHRGAWERRGRGAIAAAMVLPIVAAVAALTLVRLGATPRGGFTWAAAAAEHLATKPVFSLGLTWFITFGPILAVVLYDWHATARFLVSHRHLAVFLLACTAAAYVGGHDTERYLFWSAPVVYVLIGRAIERHRAALSSAALGAALLIAQVLSERVLWPVPSPSNAVMSYGDLPPAARSYSILNRLFVIDDFHWNLWSNFGSRPFHLLLLALYLAFTAVVVVWMHRREHSGLLAGGTA